MATNMDRLYETIRRAPFNERGEGRTFAACHNLAGLFETLPPGSTVVWPLPRHDWTRHIIPMLHGVFEEHGLHVAWDERRMKLFCKDSAVWCVFVAKPEDLRGREIRAVVDDLGEYDEFTPSGVARLMGEAMKKRYRPLVAENST